MCELNNLIVIQGYPRKFKVFLDKSGKFTMVIACLFIAALL